MMTTEELLIHELAKRAGVSVRTIRYYIEEGLLPEPKYQGKYSYYTPTYLDRLELIRRLKDTYLPLREIREIMNSLTDEEVRRRLKESPQSSPKLSLQPEPPRARAKPGARALEYIDRVTEEQNIYRTKGSQEKNQPTHVEDRDRWATAQISQPAKPPESQSELRESVFRAAQPQPAQAGQAETWQRISLAPGVELHLHRPLDRAIEEKVHQLLFFARKIFMKDPKEG